MVKIGGRPVKKKRIINMLCEHRKAITAVENQADNHGKMLRDLASDNKRLVERMGEIYERLPNIDDLIDEIMGEIYERLPNIDDLIDEMTKDLPDDNEIEFVDDKSPNKPDPNGFDPTDYKGVPTTLDNLEKHNKMHRRLQTEIRRKKKKG
jgi:hypothetical protein